MGHPRLHHVRRGAGEPLLLIMGMGGHHRMWGEPLLGLLEPAFELVAFDHRGIGTSDRADDQFTIADLADDAARVLDEVGWDRAHVFGISLGGMVAQELALRYPERVRTLTLGCTYPGVGGDLTAPGPQRAIAAGLSGDRELSVRTMFEVNVSAAYAAAAGNFDVFREQALSVRVPIPVVLMQSQAVLGHDALARLSGITAPTMVIHGTADEMLLPANAELIAKAIPGAQLEMFEGVGHLFWWEEPERTASLLRGQAGPAA
jgi:pimeloyl-ACP methyl ester carboxylesterase